MMKKKNCPISKKKIEKKLIEFFGNTFLKCKLLDIYEERKNNKLLEELNKKVVYIEDLEKRKKWCFNIKFSKIHFVEFLSLLFFIIGFLVALKYSY